MAKAKKVTENVKFEQSETVEVTLKDKNLSGIIFNGMFLEFPNGKAIVFQSAAEKLRQEGFIE